MKTIRTAVIADIHGNLSALNACLADIRKEQCKRIICLGDIVAKGLHNHECCQLIRENCDIVIQGNCDEFFSRDLSSFDNEREKQLCEAYQKTMDKEDIAWLANLPFSYECMISGRLVRMFHAGPDSVNNYETNTLYASVDEKYSMFAPCAGSESDQYADAVFFGHVHMQMLNRLYNRMLVCPGSVGNPLDFIRNDTKDGDERNTCNAQYVIITGTDSDEYGPFHTDFRQVPYDIAGELRASEEFFEYDDLAYELKTGKYRRYEKIRKVLLKDGIDLDLV